jgi:hypothetical protein
MLILELLGQVAFGEDNFAQIRLIAAMSLDERARSFALAA